MTHRRILFLSGLDFKEKSIQVIRKTPEAYLKSDWKVYYIVARDNSVEGNYSYENELNIEGMNITRIYYPFTLVKDRLKRGLLKKIVIKLSNYLVVMLLALKASKCLRTEKIDVIYGYEVIGVLAVHLLKIFGKLKKIRIVSRFQGTWFHFILTRKKYLKALLNWEHFLALYLASDLCIMTNDGTQGDKALRAIKSRNLHNFKFWVNGVDELEISEKEKDAYREKLNIRDRFMFLTICRLEKWKRLDRVIEVCNLLVNTYNHLKFTLYIIGDGAEKKELSDLAIKYGIQDYVSFEGAKIHSEVKYYLNIADIFFSTYDSSNVGNPLLEAIRTNKIIFTLDNGDTGSWIEHEINGFIYGINQNLYDSIAKDVLRVVNDFRLREKIISNIKQTEKKKLWTWDERLQTEVREVEALINGKRAH
jgi:glycosyltransferase involved in cell wall biosynthesis